ncbi:cytochrome c oxidase assembly protein [Nocardia ninae]|uniref:Cytochrome c oxidase assembly protein n=1 Tax=Nocardia ninae NBRC 108245 TaxID=1210091 RepID=A0A511M8E8_9NOCA|nr:hypothetical protein NN4_09960 [Nocardia ninae NBRC 108245]
MNLADTVHLPTAPPSLGTLLEWNPQPVPLLPIIGLTLAAVYGWGVLRMHRSGRGWPWWRTACFVSGCLLLVVVMGLAIEGYGHKVFSVWMFQHLTLSITIPPLLVLGSPGQLLLRASAHHGLGRLLLVAALAGLRSRTARTLLHPAVTIPVFLFSYYGLYFTPILDTVASVWFGHIGVEVFFLATGVLFIVPILSTGPLPIRQTNLGRLFDIFLEMPLHVFFGVVLMMATTPVLSMFTDPPAGWGIDPLMDQQTAGALAWSYGEPIAVVIVVVFAARWYRDETRGTSTGLLHAQRGEDEDREAYNNYLRQLHHRGSA